MHLLCYKGDGALGIHQGRANLLAVLQCSLWGKGQGGNSLACLLICSSLFNGLLDFRVRLGASPNTTTTVTHSHLWVPLSQSLPHSPQRSAASPTSKVCHVAMVFLSWSTWSAALLVWLFWLIFSLILWLSEFHAVWFSGTFGCLLILDWLLSSFWLFEEVKGLYLHPHLGQNSLNF